MAAGGFKEFVAGEVLDQDEINDYLMQGMLVFAGTAARGSAIPSPVEGQFTFLKDSDKTQFFDGSQWVDLSTVNVGVEYLVVAGGGGGGAGGGGGGGGGVLPGSLALPLNTAATVTVGGGGTGGSQSTDNATQGVSSVFATIVAAGGGQGRGTIGVGGSGDGFSGGSGGGAGRDPIGVGGAGNTPATNPRQGFNGGDSDPAGVGRGGGGGGGSLAATSSAGGRGRESLITDTLSYYSGGGGGGHRGGDGWAPGGLGGGGENTGGGNVTGDPGDANTGGGGAGGQQNSSTFASLAGGNGGSGIVILRYPSTFSLTVGAGLTSSTSTYGSFKVTSFTAGSDTVEFS